MLSCEENADTTLVYATRARDIARRIDYPKGVADATNNLGIFFDINAAPNSPFIITAMPAAHHRTARNRLRCSRADAAENTGECYRPFTTNRPAVGLSRGRKATTPDRHERGPAYHPGRSRKLTRVLDNLFVNAIKFSPEKATIELCAETRPKELIISVHDTGVGIPGDMAALLFEPFVNSVRRKGTAGEQSFGLGLYICRQIVEAHNGRIWFESEPGKGSVFFISLPIA